MPNDSLFSPESKYLIENWSTFSDMLTRWERAKEEAPGILAALAQLIESDCTELKIDIAAPSQLSLAKNSWSVGSSEPLVWVGVEEFSLEALLSKEVKGGIYLYIWADTSEVLQKLEPTVRPVFESNQLSKIGWEWNPRYKQYLMGFWLRATPHQVASGQIVDIIFEKLMSTKPLWDVITNTLQDSP